ncbi:hypothetical protein B0H34DRAFT_448189 [Crassisporium funariophilum]|nr:hypothetical protein B0H34DRAFT_448189 [Crassisporium funariophilum]
MAFMSLQRDFVSRIYAAVPSFSRSLFNKASIRPVPPIRDPSVLAQVPRAHPFRVESIKSPEDFLKAIGRSSETKFSPENWEDLWKSNGLKLRKAGISVRDRRYILWCMEKYRLGYPIEEFAHEPPPKKTVRGWGPKVQNGKRIRSRRLKDKK